MFDLSGKTALVTGATGGLGSAIAKALHAQGATVVVSGTRQEVLDALVKDLGSRAFAAPCNLKDPEAVNGLIAHAETLVGQVDILVNNAGLTRDALALRMKDEDLQEVLEVNLISSFRLMRSAMKGMMKRRFGRIINITSIVGTTGNPGQANYCASKAGLQGMTKSLAQELASRQITVNCVAPGFMETAMTHVLPAEQKEKLLQNIPQGRMGTPEDIAAAVVFLASDEANYMTGQTLHMNGGMAMV